MAAEVVLVRARAASRRGYVEPQDIGRHDDRALLTRGGAQRRQGQLRLTVREGLVPQAQPGTGGAGGRVDGPPSDTDQESVPAHGATIGVDRD